MAITLVGTAQIGGASNGGDVTLTFDGSPAENDYVLVFGGHAQEATSTGAVGPSDAGYTEITSLNTSNQWSGVWYKKLGASPDTSVTGQGSGNTRHATVYSSYVLRGVDGTTFEDAANTETTEGSDASFDSPSITTVTDLAWVFSFACASQNISITGAPSGYSDFVSQTQSDTRRYVMGSARVEVSPAGAEDPGTFSDDGTPGSTNWDVSVAVRPAGGAPEVVIVKRELMTMGAGR